MFLIKLYPFEFKITFKGLIASFFLILLLSNSVLLGQGPFIHEATIENINFNSTEIDTSVLNEKPNRLFFITQNWNVNFVYNNQSVGVWYDTGLKSWNIFNQSGDNIPLNAAFNVFIPGPTDDVFFHVHDSMQPNLPWTFMDNALVNNNPDKILIVTQNWNPTGTFYGVYNDSPIGVIYDYGDQRWGILNESNENIKYSAGFNVMVRDSSDKAFVHFANSGNTLSHVTYLDNKYLNNNPDAKVFVTQYWYNKPPIEFGVYNNHNIGVYYAGNKWAIFNQDLVNMPNGAAFMVVVFEDGFTDTPELISKSDIKVYPNVVNPGDYINIEPGKNTLIDGRVSETEVSVFSMDGKLIETKTESIQTIGVETIRFKIPVLPSGLYLIQTRIDGTIYTNNIMIK